MTSTDRQTSPLYPWEKWRNIEVKAEEWSWVFNLREGDFQTLEQDWEHKRDGDGISIQRKAVSQPRNPANWPRVSFAVMKEMREYARDTDTSIRKAFMKLYDRKKLSDEQIELLAQAPDYFIEGPRQVDLHEHEKQRSAKTAAFLAEVDGTQKQVAPKLKAQPVPTG